MQIRGLPQTDLDEVKFADLFSVFQFACHQCSVEHGFYEGTEQIPARFIIADKLLLTVSEICEAYEGHRNAKAHLPDEHCPEFTNEEIETADAIIRLLDKAEYRKLRIGLALLAKFRYNQSRPFKHGKQF